MVALFFLQFLLIQFVQPCLADTTISGFDFLEKVFRELLGRNLTELDAMQSQLLDNYPDGKYHLDWPISRGYAAKLLFRIMKSVKNVRATPGFFPDVELSSTLYPVLALVGGAFPPQEKKRFGVDALLTQADADKMIENLVKLFPEKIEFSEPFLEKIGRPMNLAVSGKHFDQMFRFSGYDDPSKPSTQDSSASETKRIDKLLSFVPPAQFSPQSTFDLRQTVESMDEVETHLESLEMTVFELVEWQPADNPEIREIKDSLKSIQAVIGPQLEKLRFASAQLGAALFTDSDSIRVSDVLKKRVRFGYSRLFRLNQRIQNRLKTLPPEENKQ